MFELCISSIYILFKRLNGLVTSYGSSSRPNWFLPFSINICSTSIFLTTIGYLQLWKPKLLLVSKQACPCPLWILHLHQESIEPFWCWDFEPMCSLQMCNSQKDNRCPQCLLPEIYHVFPPTEEVVHYFIWE